MDHKLVWQHDPGFHSILSFNHFTEIRTGANCFSRHHHHHVPPKKLLAISSMEYGDLT